MADDQRIVRIEDKIDKVMEHVGSIDTTLAAQHESLKLHMHRTDLLEKALNPIQEHVMIVKGAIQLLGAIVVMATFAAAVIEILSYLRR